MPFTILFHFLRSDNLLHWLLCAGKHSSWWGVSATKMYQRGSVIRWRREEAPDFWPQQAWGGDRKQASQVFGFYVESPIMGYGVSSHHGHCFGQWRGNYYNLQSWLKSSSPLARMRVSFFASPNCLCYLKIINKPLIQSYNSHIHSYMT